VNTSLIQQIAPWLNGIAITSFVAIEIFWYLKEKKVLREIPSLLIGFLIYNFPFWVLALSIYFNPTPDGWSVLLRIMFLLLAIPVNLWLHYHGDKGANSIGMATVFFLMVSVPLVCVIEIFLALY
jgi:hypothetical protein